MGQVCCKWVKRAAGVSGVSSVSSGAQEGQVRCKWAASWSSGPSGLQVGQVGQVCRQWGKCAASGSSGLPAATQSSHQKSFPQTEKSPSNCLLCEGDCCDFQAFYSLLSAGDPPDPSDSLRTAFAGLPPHAKSPSNSIDFEGDFGEVDSGLYSHLQHI